PHQPPLRRGHFVVMSLHLLPRRPPRPPLFPYTTLLRPAHCCRASDCCARASAPPASWGSGSSSSPCSPGPSICSSRGPCVRSKRDRKSTRLNSSHVSIAYAVFCLIEKIVEQTFPHVTLL